MVQPGCRTSAIPPGSVYCQVKVDLPGGAELLGLRSEPRRSRQQDDDNPTQGDGGGDQNAAQRCLLRPGRRSWHNESDVLPPGGHRLGHAGLYSVSRFRQGAGKPLRIECKLRPLDDFQQAEARKRQNGIGRQAQAGPKGEGIEAVGAGNEQGHYGAVATTAKLPGKLLNGGNTCGEPV